MARWIPLIIVIVLISGVYVWQQNHEVIHPPGIVAPDPPIQETMERGKPIRHRGYFLTPVARFETESRVLAKKFYSTDRTADLAPYDLAVGWGPMSDTSILDQFSIKQVNRAYAWSTDHYPIPYEDVVSNSTNMHIVPANAKISKALNRVRAGHIIRLRGYLVNVLANDGSRWKTSLTRRDAGIGACEIVWVESLEIVER